MAWDEGLAGRVRAAMAGCGAVVEKRMFGGLTFMLDGHMCCGVAGGELMVRVGPRDYEEALAEPHAREMDFTGKPLRGFVYVGADGLEGEEALQAWIERGVGFVRSLPPKWRLSRI